MPYTDLKFKIVKLTDADILSALREISSESPLRFENIDLQMAYDGPSINTTPNDFNTNERLRRITSLLSELVKRFTCHFDHNLRVIIDRSTDQVHDEVTVNLRSVSENVDSGVSKIISLLRIHLKAVGSKMVLQSALGEETKRLFETREAELARLERISETIIFDQQEFLRKKTEEFDAQRQQLYEEFKAKQEKLEKSHASRLQLLDEQEESLKKRLAEIDDRESKHVRRKIREDWKDELKKRSSKFELTLGTQNLRKPIFLFSFVLLCFSGIGTIFYSIVTFMNLVSGNATDSYTWAVTIKQLAFAVAFASTSIFFIRWNNRWFEQHAKEEFRLKRLEIDLDRASWIVEMAFEWQKEKGSEIPVQLIEQLCQNLFADDKTREYPLHPSEQLASAIFGASSSASLKFPGGSEVNLDRKSIKELDKQ